MINKRALLVTYHLRGTKRLGGFHFIADLLTRSGFDVDMLTVPVSISWVWKTSDRENLRNLIRLMRGTEEVIGTVTVRNFGWPTWVPYRVTKLIPGSGPEKALVPNWSRLAYKLNDAYDVIIVESTAGVLLMPKLRERYPQAVAVYRPSDPLAAYTAERPLVWGERRALELADQVWVINESSIRFYEKYFGFRSSTVHVVPNPLLSADQVGRIGLDIPSKLNPDRRRKCVYIGVFPPDIALLRFLSERFPKTEFIMIGPHTRWRRKWKNIIFTGPVAPDRLGEFLQSADVGLIPIIKRGEINDLFGITRKVASYMQYGLPIVAINVSPEIAQHGIFVAQSYEEFAEGLQEALSLGPEERVQLVQRYREALKGYTYETFEGTVRSLLRGFCW